MRDAQLALHPTGSGLPRRRPEAVIADKAYSSRAVGRACGATARSYERLPVHDGRHAGRGAGPTGVPDARTSARRALKGRPDLFEVTGWTTAPHPLDGRVGGAVGCQTAVVRKAAQAAGGTVRTGPSVTLESRMCTAAG
ncbi:hypothetical protein C5746_29460 [Streptomyces atratus]|uniref:Transposase DDE domain-containing protein n=1 Tax=Streptomyces atratus TaxID=1893 RepID=A0A2Z5JJE3_STRAR|nr:hypothetical protein C5746_29460 [Streptomyces atratus]